ncbi:MAG: hypothetical protein KY467_00590 [Gemmatimonadetes bacterium]|nr:hypothetical protein [Gemmatimonadota bacterium]
MRYAKSFLAAFAFAVVALSGSTAQAAPTESSIIFVDSNGDVDEVWFVFVDGELALI